MDSSTNLRYSLNMRGVRYGVITIIIIIVLYQILEQFCPNPEEVHCAAALSCPDRNRSKKFLPGMFIASCSYYKISYHYLCESAINCCFR